MIGGSVTGLLAARVLARHFERVTVIERDRFPTDGPEFRKGVPQSHHHHIMLVRGRDLMEEFFPGFDAELAALGAPLVDYTNDCALIAPAGQVPRFPSNLKIRPCRRTLIDWVVRGRLLAMSNITFLEATRVSGWVTDAGHSRVLGVKLEGMGTDASPASPRAPSELVADLVVDASGRTSRTPEWLKSLGYAAPEEQVVNSFLGYASRLYKKPANFNGKFRAVEVASQPPHNPRAAGLWEVEGDQWLLTLIGAAKEYPPTDEAGFLEFARSLADPLIYESIRNAEPLSPIHGHRGTENRWRHYERLRRFPAGLVVTGDGVCAFNPLYGQGMTLAAMGAEALNDALHRASRDGDTRLLNLAHQFHAKLHKNIGPAWLLATSDDFRWPSTVGGKPDWLTRLSYRYLDLLTPLSLTSREVVEAFLSVANMVKSPLALLHPRILGQLLVSIARRPTVSRSNEGATPS